MSAPLLATPRPAWLVPFQSLPDGRATGARVVGAFGPPFSSVMLHIPSRMLASLVFAAQAAYPLEICGLMAGRAGLVERIYQIENRLASRHAYEMEPRQLVEAMLDIADRGWELVAIFHSHPDGPAAPSAADVAQANYPEAAQVIISLDPVQQPGVRAYTIVEGRFEPIAWQSV